MNSFWFSLEMPQNLRRFYFSSFSVFNLVTCFSSKCPTFPIWFWNWGISRKIETLRIFGHFREKSKCHHVNNFSFACFLGYFKVRTVLLNWRMYILLNRTILVIVIIVQNSKKSYFWSVSSTPLKRKKIHFISFM